uniref:Uncharacterized protein n=2 Tax=Chrysotila carterae TaxID=13221 RepID=A0A6T0DSM7_CHRCT|eukprot:5185464-Pleurochrysis_carterae.AAC.2
MLLATAAPSGADASYALYKASQDSYAQRKEEGYVPTATSDRQSLAEIQAEIARKRPRSELQKKRKPQYCAGQMGTVQPMMENICENIGLSKADQSNTLPDAYGNMNVGAYAEKLERERLEREAAAKAARTAGRS